MIRRRKDATLDCSFVDVNYVDLERDPIGQVEKVYGRLDMELTREARAKMQAFVAEHRKGKFGAHRYRIEDTGLSIPEVRERFKRYLDHFDVPIEN